MLDGLKKRMFKKYIYNYICKHKADVVKYKMDTCEIDSFLYARIFELSIRTLIFEMHFMKKNRTLKGCTPEKRFNYFEKITEGENFQNYISCKYPLLEERIIELIKNTYDFAFEIYENFEIDKNLIRSEINGDIDKICRLSFGKGDTHNNGRCVTIVTTNAGEIVYKPHSLACDKAFKKVLSWVNNKGARYKLKNVNFIDCGSHGWQECVQYEGELSNKEAEEYYYKCGQFLSLFYILGTTDMHFENVIVRRTDPCFIDLETMIDAKSVSEFSNVMQTDFIPGLNNNTVYDYDYSGVCGSGNIYSKTKSISLIDVGTDNMRVSEVESLIKQKKNLVFVNGRKTQIEKYSGIILDGFKDLWQLIEKDKSSFLAELDKIFFDQSHYRQVLRSTQVYSKFLVALAHPEYLKSQEAADSIYKYLLDNAKNAKQKLRVDAEIEQLRKGDVPYFSAVYDSRDLYDCGALVCRDYFENSIKQSIRNRIMNGISRDEKYKQMDIIKKSLFSAYSEHFSDFGKGDPITDEDKYMDMTALDIYRKIETHADEALMYINTLSDGKYGISNINLDVYDGGGIIWFLSCYGAIKKDKKISETSIRLYNTSEKCYEIKNKSILCQMSGFFGIGSIIYLSFNMYQLTGEDKCREVYEKYLQKLNYILPKQEWDYNNSLQFDYICGISGLIVALTNIWKINKDVRIKDSINDLKGILSRYTSSNYKIKTGIAHGLSGIAYALCKLYEVNGKKLYLEKAFELLEIEMDTWIRENKKELEWGTGISGMLFVRAYILHRTNCRKGTLEKQIQSLCELAACTKINIKDNCLCNGICGIKESVNAIKENISGEYCEYLKTDILQEVDFFGLNNHRIENFMTGSSGVAYSYLRHKKRLPFIMALEAYAE